MPAETRVQECKRSICTLSQSTQQGSNPGAHCSILCEPKSESLTVCAGGQEMLCKVKMKSRALPKKQKEVFYSIQAASLFVGTSHSQDRSSVFSRSLKTHQALRWSNFTGHFLPKLTHSDNYHSHGGSSWSPAASSVVFFCAFLPAPHFYSEVSSFVLPHLNTMMPVPRGQLATEWAVHHNKLFFLF